ncbi:MAG: nucleotide exchange factor GrpE [Euryarchaeota archaeon]|nr:nucleotide exchange factor GrpE [Euryarchaeota archaeon]
MTHKRSKRSDITNDESEKADNDVPEETADPRDVEIAQLKDQLMRNRAEFENFRNRNRKEKEEYRKFAVENIMMDLLEVSDNFERALVSARKANDANSVIEGVEMVFKQFNSILEKEGVQKMECQGEEFDPHLHEAMMYIESDEYPDDTIIEVCKPGYEMNSKVIRHAMVTVAKNQNKSDKDK